MAHYAVHYGCLNSGEIFGFTIHKTNTDNFAKFEIKKNCSCRVTKVSKAIIASRCKCYMVIPTMYFLTKAMEEEQQDKYNSTESLFK